MTRFWNRCLVWCVCLLSLAAWAEAAPQAPPPIPPGAQRPGMPPPPAPPSPLQMLRVYIDCDFCDMEHLRTEVTFVDYMRDRKDGDVHVLVTTQSTGGGGTAWTLKFIGLGKYQGQDRTLTFNTPQTASEDDQRKEFARIVKIGLISYAVDTAALPRLDVSYKAVTENTVPAKTHDPWNFWVFRINANGNFNGEETSSNKRYNLNASANRTTEKWKISLNGNRNENRSSYDLGDGDIFKSRQSSWSASALVVKSAGPKLSFGVRTATSGATFSNQDATFTLMPGVEYDIFPYAENTRRSLTLTYSAGLAYYNYTDITIFDKMAETVPQHSLGASLGLRQPWGSISTSINYNAQFLHPDLYNLGVFGSADVRLFKGFSFNIFGDYSRIRDQIGLRKGEASTEDVLLRLRQLQSGYSYFVGFGISYSFGSIYNNVVNPRYGGSGGGMFMMF